MGQRQRQILITAGGTRDYIDPVRFIANASTGRMGYALARAAARAGHRVTLIAANTALKAPPGVTVVPVVTGREMFRAVEAHFADCDCLIMAAAVSDYRPAQPRGTKLKKSTAELTLTLKPTRDILKWAGRRKRPGQIVVGFALEDRQLRENAVEKMTRKNLDMIVANAPAAIGADRSTLHIKTRTGDWQTFANLRKTASAGRILRCLDALTASGQ